MADTIQRLVTSTPGRALAGRLGVPTPAPLRRYEPGQPLLTGPALLGEAPGGRLGKAVAAVLAEAGAEIHTAAGDDEYGAVIFDATGIRRSEDLRAARDFLSPVVRRLAGSGRLLVLGTPPEAAGDRHERVAQRALEGLTRSAGKELKRGATVQLVHVEPGAEGNLETTLRFLLSAKSAYVSGQVVRVGHGDPHPPEDSERPLAGETAVVTGAARGIGEAIAATLARDGADVVCVDVPAQGEALAAVANRIGGTALQLDITAPEAPETLVTALRERHGGADVVVHNAGITRDKTLGRMDEDRWDAVIAVNLIAPERITDALLAADGALGPRPRIVCVSSTSGIAGNAGQTNYATSKAGIIGLVDALAPQLGGRGGSINAVAPGFIETQMTAAMPVVTREAGRRLNSLSQGGLPVDVAEAIAWLANPGSVAVNGTVVRVCGQSFLGA